MVSVSIWLKVSANLGFGFGIGPKTKSGFGRTICYWTKKLTSSKAQWSITRVMKVEKQFEAIKKPAPSNFSTYVLAVVYFVVAVV